uniref:Putative secreted protein n=1 Tax=Ixodes ricinus TaxID=34613 RepID=A0A6B0TSG7_IXORI
MFIFVCFVLCSVGLSYVLDGVRSKLNEVAFLKRMREWHFLAVGYRRVLQSHVERLVRDSEPVKRCSDGYSL